ncbi:MAG: nitrogen fixation protein NifM [Motiliproteus sp.]
MKLPSHYAQDHAYYLLRAAQHHFQLQPHELSAEQHQWLETRVSNQQVMEANVLSSAEAANVIVPDELLRKALAEIEAQYEDVAALQDDLQRVDLTLSTLGELLERQLRVELILERQAATVAAASKADARHYYESHPQQFTQPERRQAWHLLITINPDYPENRRSRVLNKLNKIRAEIDGDLDRFQRQAQRHSECPSALKSGEMGWIPQGHLYPEIDKALFALNAGEISELIETEVGLHLVMCSEIQTAQRIPFAEVLSTLQQKLTEVQQRKAQQAWMRSLT